MGFFLFNFLLTRQSAITYKYFIEKPTAYNLERAERLSNSIYSSFKQEVRSPEKESIRSFINKYNNIPFLSVNFIFPDENGDMHSALGNIDEIDILSAEYVYPIKHFGKDVGTLLVHDINKEYKKGLYEYQHMLTLTRVFFGVLLFLLLFIILYREYSAGIEEQKRIAEYQAVHDGLTGLHTHKYFKEHLTQELSLSYKYKKPLALVMCDVDFFKKFNDTYGHLIGDSVLKTVTSVISNSVRSFDLVARYGGEEFAVLLMESGTRKRNEFKQEETDSFAEEALDIAKRIKNNVQDTLITIDIERQVGVTLSMGLAIFDGSLGYTAEKLISEADLALYESKSNGRNRITVFQPDTKEFVEYV